MPGPASIGASRLGAASPAVNRTTVSGDERPAWSGETRRALRGTGASGRPGPTRSRPRPLPRDTVHGPPDPGRVRGEGHFHAGVRQHDHGRLVRCGEIVEQSLDRVSEQLFATGDERLLVDDEGHAAARRNIVVGPEGRGQARRRVRRNRQRRRGHTPERTLRTEPAADSDLHLGRLEIGHRRPVGLHRHEVDDGPGWRPRRTRGLARRRHAAGAGRDDHQRRHDGRTPGTPP